MSARTVARHFSVADRLLLRSYGAEPVWSDEYDLNRTWSPRSPRSPLLDELRQPMWWTGAGVVLGEGQPRENGGDSAGLVGRSGLDLATVAEHPTLQAVTS